MKKVIPDREKVIKAISDRFHLANGSKLIEIYHKKFNLKIIYKMDRKTWLNCLYSKEGFLELSGTNYIIHDSGFRSTILSEFLNFVPEGCNMEMISYNTFAIYEN